MKRRMLVAMALLTMAPVGFAKAKDLMPKDVLEHLQKNPEGWKDHVDKNKQRPQEQLAGRAFGLSTTTFDPRWAGLPSIVNPSIWSDHTVSTTRDV